MSNPITAFAPILSAAAIALFSANAHAEVSYAQYNNINSYIYKITHMPDFDQRRAESADGTIPGLPNNGSMYCVPTSNMNLCAYIATHGFPDVPPQDYPWGQPSSYDVATGSDFILGLLMNTSPTGGTGGNGWYNGMQAWVPLDKFTVNAYFADDSWWPRRWDLAESAINGGLISFCWGWYDITGEFAGVPIVTRSGGHCVTQTECFGGVWDAWVKVRDPADDSMNLTTQSPFMNRMYFSETRTIYRNGIFRNIDNLDTTTGNDVRRILDGYCSVRPKMGVTFSEPEQEWTFQLAGDFIGSITSLWGDLPAEEPVVGYVAGLHQNNLYAIVDLGEGNHALQCYPFGGGDPITMDITFSQVDGVTIGTHHRLYIASDDQMHMVDVGGGNMSYLWTFPMPGTAAAMAYDDDNDHVLVYDPDNFAVISHVWHGDGEATWTSVPEVIAAAGDQVAMAWDPTRNAVWMLAGDDPVVYMIPLDGGAYSEVALQDATDLTSIDVDDQGHLFVANNGVLQEYMQTDAAGWVHNVNGPLDGMAVGQTFFVTRSRTNFDPNLHTEGWHNVPPADEFGIPFPDCTGDVNSDGAVDFNDLLTLLATFGPCPTDADCSADLNGDNNVGFLDLLIVLAAWGPCPG